MTGGVAPTDPSISLADTILTQIDTTDNREKSERASYTYTKKVIHIQKKVIHIQKKVIHIQKKSYTYTKKKGTLGICCFLNLQIPEVCKTCLYYLLII